MTPPYQLAIRSLCCLLLCLGVHTSAAQTPAAGALTPGDALEGPVRPETIAARKAAIQGRLESLAQEALPQEDAEAMRATLDQQLKTLTALETALQKRAAYVHQVEQLPQLVDELTTERQALVARPARRFPQVTEKLRDEQEARLQDAHTKLDTLQKEQAAADLRLTSIAKDIEQLAANRDQIEKDLAAVRSEVGEHAEQQAPLLARVALLDLRLQLQQAEIDTREAERDFLSRQGPLQDARAALAQAHVTLLQRELETIKTALSQVLSQQHEELTSSAEALERQLQLTNDPTDLFALRVALQNVALRKTTADYRQQLEHLGDANIDQERRNAREKHEAEHLTSLVEKYASGERVAQRLQAAFTRLQRERWRYDHEKVTALDNALDTFVGAELELAERLYDFERDTASRLSQLSSALQTLTPEQRDAQLAKGRKALETQKTALREQQQVLNELIQDHTKLITLHRDYKRLLDDGYRYVLTKIFWLRDGQPFGWRVFQDAALGLGTLQTRFQAFGYDAWARLPRAQADAVRGWGLLLLLVLGVPWLGLRLHRSIRQRLHQALAAETAQETRGIRSLTMALLILQAVLWPAYLLLVTWVWTHVLTTGLSGHDFAVPLEASAQQSALVLWGWLAGWTMFRAQGWFQHYWGCSTAACRALQRAVTCACLAVFLCLIPRAFFLATATGDPQTVAAHLAWARLCFTAFEVIILGLVAVMCRRRSALLTTVLAESRQAHGLLWRNWPLVYLGMLTGMSVMTALDLLGYRYAARSLWLKSGKALLVILVLFVLNHAVNTIVERVTRQRRRLEETPVDPSQPTRRSLLQQGRQFVRVLLILSGLVVIQDLYGMSQGLFSALHAMRVLELGRTADGQVLWLTLGDVTTALIIIASTILLLRHLPGIYEVALFPRVQWDSGLRYTFLTLSRYTLLFLGLWWGLSALHMRWSSIQWIVAAVSVGVGFGLQEVVSNFVSGLILLLERPIRVEDLITVGDQTGVVKRITIRATAIQNRDNLTVIIPNKEFIAGRVINWTLGDTQVRLAIGVGVAYGSDLELVLRLLTAIVVGHPRVLASPAPEVLMRSFGESALQWELSCFVARPQERLVVTHDLLLQIDRTFRAHQISMPFPQYDLHLRSADAALLVQPMPTNGAGSPP